MAKAKEKVPWGTYSMVFWNFYESGAQKHREEFSDIYPAMQAQRSMLCITKRKGIHEVKIKRCRNVLYLERTKGNARRNNSGN